MKALDQARAGRATAPLRGAVATEALPGRVARGLGRLARSASVIRRLGGGRALTSMLGTFLFTRQRLEVFLLELTPDYAPPPRDPRLEVRPARPEDLARLRESPEASRSEFYRDEIDGAEAWIGLWEGRAVHVAWIYDSRLPNRFVRLGPAEAELRYGYTFQAFRTRGLYGATNAAMAAELARRGYRRVYGVVVDHGPAFRLGLELALRRIGFRRHRSCTHLRVLGVQLRPHLAL